MLKLLLAACTPVLVTCAPVPVVEQAPIPVHWVVDEYDREPFDARHGDRVDVEMDPEGDVLARCEDMAGELIWTDDEATSAHYVCEDVDF